MSTRKASRVMRRVGMVRMSKARRYLGELEGEWKCVATASPKQTSVRNAETGCTMRMEESECRVADGRVKSPVLSLENILSTNC